MNIFKVDQAWTGLSWDVRCKICDDYIAKSLTRREVQDLIVAHGILHGLTSMPDENPFQWNMARVNDQARYTLFCKVCQSWPVKLVEKSAALEAEKQHALEHGWPEDWRTRLEDK